MSVERRCSRLPEGRADMKNSLRKVHRRASTSGMGTARRRLVDRSGPRGHVGPPAASQRVQDRHTGRCSSYRDSIRIVRALREHGAAFFGRSLKVSIELEDEQPQDNFRSGGILDWPLTRSWRYRLPTAAARGDGATAQAPELGPIAKLRGTNLKWPIGKVQSCSNGVEPAAGEACTLRCEERATCGRNSQLV